MMRQLARRYAEWVFAPMWVYDFNLRSATFHHDLNRGFHHTMRRFLESMSPQERALFINKPGGSV